MRCRKSCRHHKRTIEKIGSKQASEHTQPKKKMTKTAHRRKKLKEKKYQKILAKVSPVAACVRIDIKKHERGFDMVT